MRILQTSIVFTTKVEEFVAHNGPKLTYTKAPLGTEFFIQNHSLLFEQGINEVPVDINTWDDIPCFFSSGEKSSIPFDIFAAGFYLISRYEEYFPHVADTYGRYSATNSLAFQSGFLEKPVIDIWAFKLLEKLKEKYPDYPFPKKQFEYISTISVHEAFAFKHKGIIRNIGGFIVDFFRLKFRWIGKRIVVLLRLKEDPYYTYEELLALGKQYDIKTLFFFLFSGYNTYDTNISYSNTAYKLLIKSVIDYAPFGQLFSFYTMENSTKMNKEKNRLENVVNRTITKSRQHYNRLEIPGTYQMLIDAGIVEDYSMGYHTHCGFRASTCTPFYFYDLDYEIQTPLKIFSFAIRNKTLQEQLQLTPNEAYLKTMALLYEVKKVNGTFVTIFHNTTLSPLQTNKEWDKVYAKVLKDSKQ